MDQPWSRGFNLVNIASMFVIMPLLILRAHHVLPSKIWRISAALSLTAFYFSAFELVWLWKYGRIFDDFPLFAIVLPAAYLLIPGKANWPWKVTHLLRQQPCPRVQK